MDVADPVRLPPRGQSEGRVTAWLLLTVLGLLLLIQQGAVVGYDGPTMYEIGRSIVDRGEVDAPTTHVTLTGPDGRQYGRFNIGLPLLAAGAYALTAPLQWLNAPHADFLRDAAVAATMAVICALLVVAVHRLARALGASVGAAVVVGVGVVGGTFVLPYSKEFFSEPLAALGLVVAFERVLARRPLAAGSALMIGVLARAQTVLIAPLLVTVVVRRSGWRAGAVSAVPVFMALAVTVAYNLARFGHPLHFGYQDEGFTTSILHGAHMLLVHPTNSLFLFAPITLLIPWALAALWRHEQDGFLLLSGNLAIGFAVAAAWASPGGGWAWGPRLLIPAFVPAAAALAPWSVTVGRRRVVVALLAIGFVVTLPAVIVSTWAQQLDQPPPLEPTIPRQAELVVPVTVETVDTLYEAEDDGRNFARYLSFWQVAAARVLGPPGLALGLAGSVLLLAGTGFAGSRAWQGLRGLSMNAPGPG